MSDRFGLKVKENAGKTKYSSLNLNQTYKGTKVETKTSSGTARHGLQSLGKVGASRRIPPPANLPSLKSENSGNDPTVSLVPSGGGGWGSAKEKPSETPTVATPQAAPPSSTPSQTNAPSSQQPLLQPQRPTAPPSHPQHVQQPQPQSQNSGQTQTQPAKQQESQGKTWGSVSSNEGGGQGKSYSHQEMPYFNREFPVLGGGNSGERLPPHMEEKDPPHVQYGQKPMMHNTHEPAWMERSGPGPPPSDYGPGRERTDIYNGGPGPGYGGGNQYRRPPDYQHGTHGKNYPHGFPSHQYGNGPQGYGPGRHPHGYPDHHSRGPGHRPVAGPGHLHGSKMPDMGRGEGYGRPAILKPEDIQAMADNDEEEEGGWAGAQDEVDYAAKLDFEDFEEDEKPSTEALAKKLEKEAKSEPDTRWQSNEGRSVKEMGPPPTRQAWSEPSGHPHPYSENRQVPPGPGVRPFDSRGSPPAPGWPMPYPQHVPLQRGGQPAHPPPPPGSSDQGQPVPKSEEPVVNEWQKRRVKQQEEMRAAVERARKRREEEEFRRQAEQKAAATAKLKELELKRVRRESGREGDDAWAEELDSIEKDAHSKETANEQQMPDSPSRETEPHNVAVNQQDGALIRNELPEHVNRQRNDSESSDASRSSGSRGVSRPHHHPPRDIPPRFQQQQQLRQQHFQQQQHYQQQPPYPQQYPYHQQQLARSPQLREFPEGPLSIASHHHMVDSGPVSPSYAVKTDQPVRRIMKRSDSSSTAGDDIASVKSLESGSGEPSRESEKRPPTSAHEKPVKTDKTEEQAKERAADTGRPKDSRVEQKSVEDQDIPVFDEAGSLRSGETRQRTETDSDKPQLSESNKENLVLKEREHEKRERKDSREGTSKPVPDKNTQTRDRREERRSSKRDTRQQDNRRSEDNKDLGKRKRDDSEDGGQFLERRGRFAGRGDTKRERFSEFHGRGRVSFPVRGHGRGSGGTVISHRGRGRGDRGTRDTNRDSREYKPNRAREPRPSPPVKTVKDEQKHKEEDKENVVVKESTNIISNENKKVQEDTITVKQEKVQESIPSQVEKDPRETQKRDVETSTKENKKDREDSLIHESKVREDKEIPSKLPDKDVEKLKGEDDKRKKSDSYRETNDLKPKGRGGFGKPPQYSQDFKNANQDRRPGGRKFTDRRQTTQESGRDCNVDYDEKRFTRNYNRDQTSQRSTGRERGREKEHKSYSQHDDRDSGNRRSFQDDRKKRISERDNDHQPSRQRPEERNQRGGYRSPRGRLSKPPLRTGGRGGRPSQQVGSGRFGNNYRRSKSTDEELSEDDYDSDSSSYTTATSASEERRDDKSSDVEKENDLKRGKESSSTFDKSRGSLRSTRSPIRGKVSSRAGGRGAGGFGRSRREVERPPRFQKQHEKERMGRGQSHGVRPSEGRESGPGRGRGRGRGRKEQLPKDSPEGPGIPVTENWDEEPGDTPKENENLKSDKPGGRRESASRRGFSAPRSSSDRTRKDKNRELGGTRNTSSRREPFLAERQQAKVDGSKSASGEPRAPLPAARNGFNKDGNRRSDVQGYVHSTGLDSINTGVSDSKVPRKQEPPVRKTDIQQFDLHNIAGVICIDDMTDDDSDISSTLSGFVEVTSRRTQKENKDRQREEEERRKKMDEQNRQRGNQMGNKKNQPSKPPRFSKQHTSQASTQSKTPGVIGKVTSTAVPEAGIGPSLTGSNSNPSSANSTKRNSPVTIERPVSPAPPPVFNAWDKPLIVTPAKPPSVTPVVTSSIPDPLAVGTGKPSSTRPIQPQGTVISSTASLIEDISVDDDYIAMTKEIALLAPPEEPEENEEPAPIVPKTKQKVETREQTLEKGGKITDSSEKRSQPKSQREKPPRFDRSGKRKVAPSTDETKSGGPKGRKNSRDNVLSQKQAKVSGDMAVKGKTVTSASTQQQSASPEGEIPDDPEASKEVQESEEFDAPAVQDVAMAASDEGSEEKDDVKESEEHEAKDDSESESSRKDSEPDLNVDSAERNDDTDNLFSTGTLSVDIHERPTAERPAREPSPVSPAIFEMTKKMEASRKLWDSGLGIGRPSNPVAAWEETLRTSASVSSSIVGIPVVESAEARLSDDQVAVSKAQGELDSNSSKADSKPPDGINFPKKTGEQQNVCKVKPQQQQQQQPAKPQQSSSIVTQPSENQTELNAVPLSQPLVAQDHLMQQQAIPHRYAYPFVGQLVDMQQRQPYLQQQPQLQPLQQTNQQVTPPFPIAHVQQVNQARSSSSPLSQTTQDVYQSPFLTSGVYSAGNFQGSQPFVSIALLPSTTSQSFVTSSPRTQTTSLMEIQTQQPKTASGSVFPQNVNPQAAQPMYMQFDPKMLRGGTPLFNLTQQHPQSAQRHLLGAQSGIMGENMPRQGGFPTAQPTNQPFQGGYAFQQKQGTYDVSQDMQMKKTSEQTADFTRQSELVKHVNAKPFEPPKRSTPGSISSSNAAIGPMVSSTFARNPNLMNIRPSAPDLGRTSQSPPVSTSLISGRPVSMSPVDPGVPFPGAVGTFAKHAALGQFPVQQQPQGVQPQQFTPFQQQPVGIQHTLQIRAQGQQQQQGVNQLPGAAAAILPNPAVMAAAMPRQLIRAPGISPIGVGGTQPSATNAQRFPAPIQRPMTSLLHGVPHMQAPRGPHGQTVPPQMVPAKQQIVSNRPQMPPQSLPHQDPMAAAFKIEQHHKMLEQTRMFFAQQGQHQQQRVLPMNIQADQQVKAVSSTQEDKSTMKGQVPRDNQKPQEKKEEMKPHPEANPRNRKPNSEQPNKTSKTTKVDSKPEESSKDRNIATKQDGKGTANKSSSLVRIQPLPMPARNRPNRPRGPPRMPGSMPATKAKISVRPEKETKDIVPDQPSESPGPKSSDQAKTSDTQSVTPLSVNKG